MAPSLPRRAWLAQALAACAASSQAGPATGDDDISPQRRLQFPRDHGAHPGTAIEWWYATGWLDAGAGRLLGFQVTFFRSATGLAAHLPGRYAPRQILMAHAAITDVASGRHLHAQRLGRWSQSDNTPEALASLSDTRLALGSWQLQRRADGYQASWQAPEAGMSVRLELQTTQPVLLQGHEGFSQKGPLAQQASHYYTEPQMLARARLVLAGQPVQASGRAWLDHEWSQSLMAPGVVGWDWLGVNLADGGALTAFVLRRADGSVVWAGGSHRPATGPLRAFGPDDVAWQPVRQWLSPQTGGRYPVHWRITCPAGQFELRALLDAQELDSRASTGTVYWEGLSELLAPSGQRLGLGYLEMTGRAQPLRL